MVFLPWSPWNCVLPHYFYRSCVCFCYSCVPSKTRRQALSEPQLANRFSVCLLWALLVILLGVMLLGVVESHFSSTQGPVKELPFPLPGSIQLRQLLQWTGSVAYLLSWVSSTLHGWRIWKPDISPVRVPPATALDGITAYVFTPVLMLDQCYWEAWVWGAVIMKYQLSFLTLRPPYSVSVSCGLSRSFLVGKYTEACAKVEM